MKKNPTLIYYGIKTVIFFIIAILLFLLSQVINGNVIIFSALLSISIFLGFKQLFEFFIVLYRYKRVKQVLEDEENLKGVIQESGTPRTGKTSNSLSLLINHSQALWLKVQTLYMFYKNLGDYFLATSDDKMQRELKDIKRCYEFYSEHTEYIPCFASNIPVEYNGQKAYPLESAHVMQTKELPPFTDLFIDELSYFFDPIIFKDSETAADLDEFTRFCNQYLGDGVLIVGVDQDPNKSFIGFRRNVNFIKYQLGQNWVNSPTLLFKYLKKLNNKLSKHPDDIKLSYKIFKLDNLCHKIGFRRYHYVKMSNVVNPVFKDTKIYTEYRQASLECTYDDRAFSELYKTKYKGFDEKIYDSLILNPQIRETLVRYKNKKK